MAHSFSGDVNHTPDSVTRWSDSSEGQFFERKSAWDRSGERPRRLPILRRRHEIGNEDIRQALGVSRAGASRLARELCEAGWLRRRGTGRWTRYELGRGPTA